MNDKIKLVKELSNNFTKIISRDECSKHNEINWGNNGVGNRWCGKIFCYSAIKAKKYTLYNDFQGKAIVDEQKIIDFQKTFIKHHNIKKGIIFFSDACTYWMLP